MLSSPTYPKLRSELRRAPENEAPAHRELSRLLGTSALIQNHLGGRFSKMVVFVRFAPESSPTPLRIRCRSGCRERVPARKNQSLPNTNSLPKQHTSPLHARALGPEPRLRPPSAPCASRTEARRRPRASPQRRTRRPRRPRRRICSRPSLRPACFVEECRFLLPPPPNAVPRTVPRDPRRRPRKRAKTNN